MKKLWLALVALLLVTMAVPAIAGNNSSVGGGVGDRLGRPTSLSATATGVSGQVALDWEAPDGLVTNYEVRYKTPASRWTRVSTLSNDTTFVVNGLNDRRRYAFQVRAVRLGDNGPWSRRDSARPSEDSTPTPTPTPTETEPTPTPTETTPTPTPTETTPPPTGEWWVPTQGERFQYQLQGTIDTNVDVGIFDIDGADVPVSKINTIHSNGDHAVCYVSAGSYENWRLDADRFPDEVIGRSNGWPGENWIDVRALDDLIPIMEDRAAICKAKGFDAIEWDNVDGYTNNTGFPLTGADQLAYNKALADVAHDIGLGVGLKNDIEQLEELEPFFDFAVNEECVQYNECDEYQPFTDSDKAILHVEYDTGLGFCPSTEALGFSSIVKELDLFAQPIEFCP